MISRPLMPAQHAKLDKIGDAEPEAKVIGWFLDGPILYRPQNAYASYWRLAFDGRLKPVARAVLEEIRS